jgi:hypothetical protein
MLGLGSLLAGDAHGVVSLLPITCHRQLSLNKALVAGARRFEDFRKFRRDLRQRQTQNFDLGSPRQPLRGAIEYRDTSVGIHSDYAGTSAGEHRLGETAPAVD